MKYLVDEALCAAHGLCAAAAPDVYNLDDDGFNATAGKAVDVEPSQVEAARYGASACPEQAIRLTQ